MTQASFWFGPEVTGLQPVAEIGAFLTVDADFPSAREDGSILGAARHRVREARVDATLRAALRRSQGREPHVISGWVNHYAAGDFAAVHHDRQDSALTALLALDETADPLVICPPTARNTDLSVLEQARNDPFPPGERVILERHRFLFLRGALTPHHRPPATRAYRVLAITLGGGSDDG
ncbi:hypothetical protein [Streptomyces sp. bgisy153]|uniref:hypothetical protein n=1 Tax=Streptomyces sp. bgisy153 TaxID=3413793 RepID=UPI003D702713